MSSNQRVPSLDLAAYRHCSLPIQKQLLDAELESLVVPEADAATEAGHLIEKLPELWAWASVEDRRRLLVTMLDAVYVDAKEEDRIVAIKPRPPFKPIFQMATMKEGSVIVLVHERTDDDDTDEPPAHGHGLEADSCSWWRRGRVELYCEHGNSVLVAA